MSETRKILIVDDDGSLTRIVRKNLEETGRFIVREVNWAKSTLRIALDFQPDLILLDVMMPDMDGGDVAAQIRSHPKLVHVPIVFLTAAVKKTEVSAHQGLIGGLPFIAKPIDIDDLAACLDTNLAADAPSI